MKGQSRRREQTHTRTHAPVASFVCFALAGMRVELKNNSEKIAEICSFTTFTENLSHYLGTIFAAYFN